MDTREHALALVNDLLDKAKDRQEHVVGAGKVVHVLEVAKTALEAPQQHDRIKDFRTFTEEEWALINRIKAHAETTRELVTDVQHFVNGRLDELPVTQPINPARWAAIAMTDLQQGYMALTRAVAAPVTF